MAGVNVRLKVEGLDRKTAEFKQIRAHVNSRLREGLQKAGERVVLPEARRLAGNLKAGGRSVGSSLVIKARTRTAFLQTNLPAKLDRIVGLEEFGGTVHTPILPKRRSNGRPGALLINGTFVAKVTKPRHHTGKHFMERAVESGNDQIEQVLADSVMDAFRGDFEVTDG